MIPQCTTKPPDHLIERRRVGLEIGELLLPTMPVLGLARGEALRKLVSVAILEASLLLENRPRVLDVDIFFHEQPVKIREVAAELALDDAAKLLACSFLEGVRSKGHRFARLIRVSSDNRTIRCLDDQLVVGEIDLDRALASERPDVVDRRRLSVRKLKTWQFDRTRGEDQRRAD